MIKSESLPKNLLIFMSVVCFLHISVAAQDVRMFDAFEGKLNSNQQELVNSIDSKMTTKRIRLTLINKDVFEKKSLKANLFSDHSIKFDFQDIGRTGVNYQYWTGVAPEHMGSAAILINGNRISGHITSSEGNFEIFPVDDNGTHIIVENDLSKYGGCGNNEISPLQIEYDDQEFQEDSQPQNRTGKGSVQRSSESGECRIRLLVAYTPNAQINTMGAYNRTMIEHVELAILQMNQGFANSLADQRVELAHLYKTTDEETGNSTNDINDLRDTTDGKWNEIHTLRDLYNADMVALITDGSYPGMCGRAYGFNYELEANMFQITEYNCAVANFTLAHEFGHLQGCRHNVDPNDTPFSYGHGYSEGGIYQTIMAVCCGGVRVNYWSNPYVYYPGVGMMGTLNFNYNVLALNESESTIAHHRLTPSSIMTDAMLGNDHLVNSSTSGLVISADTTMQGGCLTLQSMSQVRLTSGFRSYIGSHGNYRITKGCAEAALVTSIPTPAAVSQRDGEASPSKVTYRDKATLKTSNAVESRDK